MKRSGSRNKFLTCFLPGFYMEDMILDDGFCLDLSVSDCSVSQSPEKRICCSDEDASVHRLPMGKRKRFSRSVKTIVSDLFYPQSPRAKDKKSSSNRGSDFATRVPLLTRTEKENDYSIRKESDSASPSTSSSTTSFCSSDSEDSSTAEMTRLPNPESERKLSGSGSLAVFVLMLVSVAVTVLGGGKLLGVGLTLGCLCLMPRRWGNGGDGSGVGEVKGSSSETEQKKQRMVMGGMLKRGHRRQNLESLKRFRELLSVNLEKSFLLLSDD